jgi:predicted metalloprotease with PDZ domain
MKIVLLFCVAILSFFVTGAQSIQYEVSFGNIVHHELNITLTLTGPTSEKTTFRMSRSSPGRYATHEFGKNVYNVTAADEKGAIAINRVDGDVYEVPSKHNVIKVNYTLYGNHADGTYAGIDQDGVHLNMPASFMWVKGYDQTPISIRFDVPQEKNWKIATQLQPTSNPWVFSAPGLQYFLDAPVKIGNLIFKDWTLKNPDGKPYQMRLALEAETSEKSAGNFADKVKRMTEESQAVFGELPHYDFGTYTFITSINPYVKGDGMEHRNSTMITLGTAFNPNDLSPVFSHEFFHCWNVERIRPATLEPFNFEKSNMSDGLWFAEGFTQYYGDLILARANLLPVDILMNSFKALINTKETRPGSRKYSPVEASRNAIFVDAGVSVDKTNYENFYSSYYPYGGAIALALDLSLRSKFNISLDDYMTVVWKKYGRSETPYTIEGLQQTLAETTHDVNFAKNFFDKYVNGHESFDYAPVLAKAGFVLKKEFAGMAWIGIQAYKKDNTLTIANNTVIGTPLYDAGLDIDDQILSIGGQNINSETELNTLLQSYRPGQKLPIIFIHRGTQKISEIQIAESPRMTITSFEKEGLKLTDEMISFRKKWLDTKVK